MSYFVKDELVVGVGDGEGGLQVRLLYVGELDDVFVKCEHVLISLITVVLSNMIGVNMICLNEITDVLLFYSLFMWDMTLKLSCFVLLWFWIVNVLFYKLVIFSF